VREEGEGKRVGGVGVSAGRRGEKRIGVEAYETRDPAFFIADTPYADPPIRFSHRRPVSPFASSGSKIRRDALHRSLNVFFENVLPHDSTKISNTFVLSGLESGKELLAIHHVGLDKDDRTFVKTVRQQIASPDIA
jgi:hypothetical protein